MLSSEAISTCVVLCKIFARLVCNFVLERLLVEFSCEFFTLDFVIFALSTLFSLGIETTCRSRSIWPILVNLCFVLNAALALEMFIIQQFLLFRQTDKREAMGTSTVSQERTQHIKLPESSEGQPTTEGNSDVGSRSIFRRLRIRGDWSDTGPQARPQQTARNQVIIKSHLAFPNLKNLNCIGSCLLFSTRRGV